MDELKSFKGVFVPGTTGGVASYCGQIVYAMYLASDVDKLLAEKDTEIERLNQAIEEGNRQEGWQKAEIERLKGELGEWEEREGSVCPEDISFEENIHAWTKRAEEAEANLKIAADALKWYAECHDVYMGERKYAGQKARDALDDIEKPDDPRFTVPLHDIDKSLVEEDGGKYIGPENLHERTPFSDKANLSMRVERLEAMVENIQAELIRMKQ